jgi:hypothetical protein
MELAARVVAALENTVVEMLLLEPQILAAGVVVVDQMCLEQQAALAS